MRLSIILPFAALGILACGDAAQEKRTEAQADSLRTKIRATRASIDSLRKQSEAVRAQIDSLDMKEK